MNKGIVTVHIPELAGRIDGLGIIADAFVETNHDGTYFLYVQHVGTEGVLRTDRKDLGFGLAKNPNAPALWKALDRSIALALAEHAARRR